jgi:hypothetical protein
MLRMKNVCERYFDSELTRPGVLNIVVTKCGEVVRCTAYGGVDVWLLLFLTSALDDGEGSASRPDRFNRAEINPFPRLIGF